MLMEPNTFLPAVQRDFFCRAGASSYAIFARHRRSRRCTKGTVFNCTGLGSRALFADTMLEPVRGQLTVLEPQPDVESSI